MAKSATRALAPAFQVKLRHFRKMRGMMHTSKARRTNVNGFYEDGHTSARHSAHARFGSSGKANSPNRRKEGERLGDISAEDAVGFAKGRGMSFSDSSRCVCRC